MNEDTKTKPLLVAIDQGTTSTRAIAFDLEGTVVASAQKSFPQIYPRDGWVEHDAMTIWSTAQDCLGAVLSDVGEQVSAIGITNQRETTIVWDRNTGEPVYNAIVWQDRRGASVCKALAKDGYDSVIQERTGLIPDSYFSATKLQWILESNPGIRKKAEQGQLAFGTVDTFLLWKLTNGRAHATDATNASRTMLFNIHSQTWDEELLARFGIPVSVLPTVQDTNAEFGHTDRSLFGTKIPITALIGDQQGALVGQACFTPGMAKATFGTGAFVLLNTGADARTSENNLLTTVGYRLGGTTRYALEGSVFNAGTVVQWMRDQVGLFTDAKDTEGMAAHSKDSGVTFIPAFTGLGAPHWDPDARGAILGITRDTTKADIVRAGLEAVCFQTKELLDAMAIDAEHPIDLLRVDGGMAANNWLLQFLADLLNIPVERPKNLEASVHGAALMAGLGAGLYTSLDEITQTGETDQTFSPTQTSGWRESAYGDWSRAVERIKTR